MKNALLLVALVPGFAAAEMTSPSIDAARTILAGGADHVYDGSGHASGPRISGGLTAGGFLQSSSAPRLEKDSGKRSDVQRAGRVARRLFRSGRRYRGNGIGEGVIFAAIAIALLIASMVAAVSTPAGAAFLIGAGAFAVGALVMSLTS